MSTYVVNKMSLNIKEFGAENQKVNVTRYTYKGFSVDVLESPIIYKGSQLKRIYRKGDEWVSHCRFFYAGPEKGVVEEMVGEKTSEHRKIEKEFSL